MYWFRTLTVASIYPQKQRHSGGGFLGFGEFGLAAVTFGGMFIVVRPKEIQPLVFRWVIYELLDLGRRQPRPSGAAIPSTADGAKSLVSLQGDNLGRK